MQKRGIAALTLLSAIGWAAMPANGATLFSQNFESPVTTSTNTANFGGFGNFNVGGGFQIQGGGGGSGPTVTAGVDTNGVGGSQALFVNSDNSAATSFTYGQYTTYGSVGAPGLGTLPTQVAVDLDIFMSGSETSNTPLAVLLQNGANDISFTPTLANGAFTHVHFTLDQATNGLLYDPTVNSNLRVQLGAGGFGFDSGNIVRLDNIVVATVPEPASLGVLGLGALVGLRRRR